MAANYWRYLAQGGMGGMNQMEDMVRDGDLPDDATVKVLEVVYNRLGDVVAKVKGRLPASPAPEGKDLPKRFLGS